MIILAREMEEIRASQSKMIAREEMFEKKRKPSATVSNVEGVVKKAKTGGGDVEKVIKEDTKPSTKERDAKQDIKSEVKPSVNLDKNKGLDVHVPVSNGNAIDFQSLQGLINIHFHFHNK